MADQEDQFAKEVLRLYKDCALLHKMALASRQFIRKYYSVEAAWEAVREDFQ